MAGRHRKGAPHTGSRVTRHSSGSSAPRARGEHKGTHRKGFFASLLASFTKPTPEYSGRHRNSARSNHARGQAT